MLFAGLGALALPLLWRSRRFSMLWKVILSVVVVAYTAAVLWLIWYLVEVMILAPIRELAVAGQ